MTTALKSMSVVMIVLSMLAVVALGNTASAAEKEMPSVFPACYRCGTGLPGAPTLTIQGVVSSQTGSFHGVAILTQAVSPPLNLHVPVTGYYEPAAETVRMNFHGGQLGGMVGGLLTVQDWGRPGKCQFAWYANNRFADSGGNVPAAPCK